MGKVVLIGVGLTILLIAVGVSRGIDPVVYVGVLLFIVTFIVSVSMSSVEAKKEAKTKKQTINFASKYDPLLLDDRTRQHPEIQRLLQYPEVQKVFFDPAFLKTPAAQNDPNVRELLGILDDMIITQTVNGVYPPITGQAGMIGTGGALFVENAAERKLIEEREKAKKRPRRIIGTIVMSAGLIIFLLPFGAVFFAAARNDATWLGKSLMMIAPWSSPLGMVLLVLGSILKR